MYISRLKLQNWKNFEDIDVQLSQRTFIVGPNAIGKSNLLDSLRFLRDIAKPKGGGLYESIASRGGVSKIRSLAARQNPHIGIYVEISEGKNKIWAYELAFTQSGGGATNIYVPKVKVEKVHKFENEKQILVYDRDVEQDEKDDKKLLESTRLEQATTNKDYRELVTFLASIEYLHIVPQLMRAADSFVSTQKEDFFGKSFIEKVNSTTKGRRDIYLRKITTALRAMVPQFEELTLEKDEMGVPHLAAKYKHWRPQGAKQRESQFSDGTLRLIGLFWSLLDGPNPILLEEPELSLNTAIVKKLPEIISKLQRKSSGIKQVLATTHSFEILDNLSVSLKEIVVLEPKNSEATAAYNAFERKEIKDLLEIGLTPAEIIIPRIKPTAVEQISLLDDDKIL